MKTIAFLFPGQGAQTVGMGRQLYDTLPAARRLFDRANTLLGYDLAKLCFEGRNRSWIRPSSASRPCLSPAWPRWNRSSSNRPGLSMACAAAAGLSLGEYTAMVFAGVMEFEAALAVVQIRGEAMQAASDATPSGMVSILGLELAKVEELCDRAAARAKHCRSRIVCARATSSFRVTRRPVNGRRNWPSRSAR